MNATCSVIITAAALLGTAAHAQYANGTVKIGVLTDMSGLYSDVGGGTVTAAKLAVEDFGAAAKGIRVEVVGADHLNKPDVGSNIARTWFDVDKVDVICRRVKFRRFPSSERNCAPEEQAVPRYRPCNAGPHRFEM
jgi:branched-chain amino acid transport system substrate-binding protein